MLIKHRALNCHLFLNCINLKEKRSSTEDEHLKKTNWQRRLEMQSNQTKLCKFYFTEDSSCANVSSDLLSDHLTGTREEPTHLAEVLPHDLNEVRHRKVHDVVPPGGLQHHIRS